MPTAERSLSLPTWTRSPWLHPLNDLAALDDWVGQIRPTWSLTHTRARIVAIRQETPDVRTFDLAPNWRWRGFEPGQHVNVQVEVDGVRHHRTFTLSSAPEDKVLSITVKRHGRITTAMHQRLRVGSVVTLSDAAGDFVLPNPLPGRIVLIAGGTGITPMMSFLRHLANRGHHGEILLVHIFRAQQLFAAELSALANRLPGFRIFACDTGSGGRPTAAQLLEPLPPLLHAPVYLCGPPALMREVAEYAALREVSDRLHIEHFAPPKSLPVTGERYQIRGARSQSIFAASNGPLLADAEAAGLRPKHGCRVGVCQTCKVRRLEGATIDLRTGAISSDPGALVSLCVTAAYSNLVLDL